MSVVRRLILPVLVFAIVLGSHVAWRATHPECAEDASSCGDQCAEQASWLDGYLGSGSYWLGLSYAASAAFAVAMIRRAAERRTAASRAGATRGLALSTLLPFVGCWLAGCCGSPLLPVYLNLLGARFLPFAKPAVAGLTACALALSWMWMRRREAAQAGACREPEAGCAC